MKNYSEEIALRQVRANIAAGSGNENIDQETLDQAQLSLANPATEKARKIEAIFKNAKGITTSFAYQSENIDNPTLFIFVTDPEQADYLNRVIIHQFDLGGITLSVKVVQAVAGDVVVLSEQTDTVSLTKYELFKLAMKDSPLIVKFLDIYVPLFDVTYHFCETSPKACFVGIDDLSNPDGMRAILPTDLLPELFDFGTIGCLISTFAPANEK